MLANEVNKFRQIVPTHRRRKYKDRGVISILLISPPKLIYAELFCVKNTPHFFFKLISESPCIGENFLVTKIQEKMTDNSE
jgi:hypothetical protein